MSPDNVILDFAEVRTVSHSLANELIGKLAALYGAENFKKKIKITNLSDSKWRLLVSNFSK